jgi:hypothetical protein
VSPSHRVRICLLACTLLAWPASAPANIGEDLTQLRARYGSAKAVGGQMIFQHDGYSICIYFDGIHSAMEVFVRDGSQSKSQDITQEDINKIMAAEGDGLIWAPIQTPSGKPTWLRSDNKILARFTFGEKPEDKTVTIMLNAR